jgi:DNA-directed RNA polymerase specialized sigma24 family protein
MHSRQGHECFEQLVTRHHREIYLYIARLMRGAHETEDLFQETFLRACTNLLIGSFTPVVR